jgi:ribosomal protein S18 acetylase RimI-like enzyme
MRSVASRVLLVTTPLRRDSRKKDQCGRRLLELQFREAQIPVLKAEAEPANSASSRALLTKLGIKIPPTKADFLNGRMKMWECTADGETIAHCAGDSATGEIISLSVSPRYEGQGIGRRLLSMVVDWLRAQGKERIWLAAPADPSLRAYGFYRALGWRSTREQSTDGSEILELANEARS